MIKKKLVTTLAAVAITTSFTSENDASVIVNIFVSNDDLVVK